MRIDLLARAALLGGTAAIALAAAPAWAQTAEPTTATAESPSDDVADEAADSTDGVITVTARRTEESLQTVPASVSAFDSRALDRIQATDPTGLQGAVPNLNIVQGRGSSNATNIYIRGVGQPDALQTFDPAVGVYVDDVYLSRIRGTQLDLLDVERIEVLRGPQGTLYGKNTIGGALKVITRRPGQQFRGSGTLAIGSYDQLEIKANASGPISDQIAIGMAFLRSTRDGFVEDQLSDREYNDKDTTAWRGDIAFTPSDRLRIDFAADWTEDDAAMTVGQPLNDLSTLYTPILGTILPVENQAGDGYDYEARISPSLPNTTKLKHRGVSATLAYDVNDALTFKSISALRKLDTRDFIDIDATEYNTGDVLVDVDQKQVSQEFQLTYNSDRFTGVAGLYYLKEDVSSYQEAYGSDLLRAVATIPPPDFLRTIADDLETKSKAIYANGSFSVTDTVRLSAGIRYTHEHKDYDRTTDRFLGGAFLDTYSFSPSGSWKDVSPMASIDWQATPDVMLYARVAKGFKSGGFNGRANSAAESTEYDRETVWSYEAGFKSRIASQLTLNGAVFHNDYRDFQARVGGSELDPIFGASPTLSVLNAGKLRIRGAELEAAWTPVRGLLLDSQIGYLDADYKEFDDVRFEDGSRAFQTPAFSPKWTMRFGGQYTADLGGSGSLTIGGQSRYKSRTALAVDNTFVLYPVFGSPGVGTDEEVDGLFQKGYWLHDARIVWEAPSRRYSVGVYANNLTDKLYKTDAQEFSSVGDIRTVYYGAPRTFTLRLTARY